MFKSPEDRQAQRREREARRARSEAAKAEARRLATPVGAATAAKNAGQPFFEVQLEVGGASAVILGEIEALGWRLEHAGYLFKVTHSFSTTPEIRGVTVGVFLFRNTGHPAR